MGKSLRVLIDEMNGATSHHNIVSLGRCIHSSLYRELEAAICQRNSQPLRWGLGLLDKWPFSGSSEGKSLTSRASGKASFSKAPGPIKVVVPSSQIRVDAGSCQCYNQLYGIPSGPTVPPCMQASRQAGLARRDWSHRALKGRPLKGLIRILRAL